MKSPFPAISVTRAARILAMVGTVSLVGCAAYYPDYPQQSVGTVYGGATYSNYDPYYGPGYYGPGYGGYSGYYGPAWGPTTIYYQSYSPGYYYRPGYGYYPPPRGHDHDHGPGPGGPGPGDRNPGGLVGRGREIVDNDRRRDDYRGNINPPPGHGNDRGNDGGRGGGWVNRVMPPNPNNDRRGNGPGPAPQRPVMSTPPTRMPPPQAPSSRGGGGGLIGRGRGVIGD